MPKLKMTDASIQKLSAPKGKRVEYFDATLPGFGVRVSGPTDRQPEGRKSWVLFYRFGGEQRRLTIDPPYPALSLADARRQAGDALQLIAHGKDPGQQKAETMAEAARKADTVKSVADSFISRHLEGKKRAARYVTETRRNFDNHVLPRWGARDIKSITRRDVIEMLDDIADHGTQLKDKDGKKKHAAGGPICANRVLAAIRAMFNWALRRGVLDSAPTLLVERPGEETKRERTLTPDEIRAVWCGAQAIGYPFGDFFRLALLTGQRRDEVAGAQWAHIDLAEKTWTLPAELTKAGRAHVVPLSPAAVALIKALPRKTIQTEAGPKPSPYLFTTSGARPISGYSVGKRCLDAAISGARREAELDPLPNWTTHDLRRTASTHMGRLGVARLVIEKVLNHSDRTVTAIYDRYEYLDEKRHALELWGSYVTGLMQPPDTNVTPLIRRAV
jgi:integrase